MMMTMASGVIAGFAAVWRDRCPSRLRRVGKKKKKKEAEARDAFAEFPPARRAPESAAGPQDPASVERAAPAPGLSRCSGEHHHYFTPLRQGGRLGRAACRDGGGGRGRWGRTASRSAQVSQWIKRRRPRCPAWSDITSSRPWSGEQREHRTRSLLFPFLFFSLHQSEVRKRRKFCLGPIWPSLIRPTNFAGELTRPPNR